MLTQYEHMDPDPDHTKNVWESFRIAIRNPG